MKYGPAFINLLIVVSFFIIAHNGWQLKEVGAFGSQKCLPAMNLIEAQMFK